MSDTVLEPAPVAVSSPLLIGWQEYLTFPEWGLRRIRVKIDTGACSSALDVVRYELRESPGDGTSAILYLALSRRHPERLTQVETAVQGLVGVRSSSGAREDRPVIETLVKIGPVEKRIRLTITNRSRMRFRMLLGREALAGSFLVDVSKKYLLTS